MAAIPLVGIPYETLTAADTISRLAPVIPSHTRDFPPPLTVVPKYVSLYLQPGTGLPSLA